MFLTATVSQVSYPGTMALKLTDSNWDFMSFGLPQNSELTEPFNLFMIKLRETGILNKIFRKWMAQSTHADNVFTAQGLGFENLTFPFVCLIIGIILGVTIAILERLEKTMCHNDIFRQDSSQHCALTRPGQIDNNWK